MAYFLLKLCNKRADSIYMYKNPSTIGNTTYRSNRCTWVVPEDQVREFMSGPIDYKKLIEDCLNSKQNAKVVVKKKKDR